MLPKNVGIKFAKSGMSFPNDFIIKKINFAKMEESNEKIVLLDSLFVFMFATFALAQTPTGRLSELFQVLTAFCRTQQLKLHLIKQVKYLR